ncbi:hypothetical protein [Chryseolinea lacunae]|uniref:LPS export ABC transporter periplasmic protein LptC n=1 Tax=Chryseolinea lacunae TaxID=2801331 RepID=A0ABS1L0Y4_9BACT|nr:hypothetical protein [Chryseolinea lacunae]MBL0745364.1 hypothetical protein [Chryseolinea lacunae]
MKVKIMMFRRIAIFAGCILFSSCNKAPTSVKVNYVVSNLRADVRLVVESYIDSVNFEREQNQKYHFFRMVVRETDSQTKFRIYPEIYLSSLVKDPPYQYLTLGDNTIVVNSGMERFTENDTLLKMFLKSDTLNLINDLNDDGAIDPNYQHQTFDPITWEITVNGDSIAVDKTPNAMLRGVIFLPSK